ncbi:MAG: glutamine cyclotransferase [Chitinophagaceae bacterium]|jgi:glutamine cyclotransferase|nr:glutamine cyclotransferase [Chitinophagaceae bacterium]
MLISRLPVIILLAFLVSCKDDDDDDEIITPPVPAPATLAYNIVKVYPHDTASFTQGLQWHNNFLYEGTGLEGRSTLLKVNLQDGKAVQRVDLDKAFFGEGITILDGKIYQLTWQNKKVFVYNLSNFKKIAEFSWDKEGWGITNNGQHLVISTGGNQLYFVDPANFSVQRTLNVNDNYGPVGDLNELEYVNGKIYANKWGSDYVLVIDPTSGLVESRLDFTGILQKTGMHYDGADVLNGIAYDSTKKVLYVTGKKWPALYEVTVNK